MLSDSTNLILKVLQITVCRSTHHKLAIDALRQLRMADAEAWVHLIVYHASPYLEGAKAPDDTFKDFKNHVLHVRENGWGGAVSACQQWYDSTVRSLRERNWPAAAYQAGVLSHYVTDPWMPLHTGQSETENAIHRAVEWSVNKSYDDLRDRLLGELDGYPECELPSGSDWLAETVRRGAATANAHYETIADHYDLVRGVKDPPAGLDQHLQQLFARILGWACVTFARVFERAVEEAGQPPQSQRVALTDILSDRKLPLRMVLQRIADHQERAIVAATYQELEATGRVVQNLPEDVRTVRTLHATEVLHCSESDLLNQPLRPIGAAHGLSPDTAKHVERATAETHLSPPRSSPRAKHPRTPPTFRDPPAPHNASTIRFHLSKSQPVVDAPTIGPRTATRLNAAGIHTVEDLLNANPEELAARLKETSKTARSPDPDTVRAWQAQALLACRIPNLRGHDAQILVACGIREPEQLANAELQRLWGEVAEFIARPAAQRILRDGNPPDADEVRDWIEWSRLARPLAAA